MERFKSNTSFFKRNVLVFVGIALSFYFSYHLFAGERGYFRLMALEYQIEQAQEQQAALSEQHAQLEKKVKMMRSGSICPDLLEERAKLILGYRLPNQYILRQDRL